MSHDHLTVPKPETFENRNINRVLLGLLGIGVSSLLVTLIIGFVAPAGSELRKQFAFSWLFAFLYFFTILIGCFFWILVHHATDSGWGIVVRRQMENSGKSPSVDVSVLFAAVHRPSRYLGLDRGEG